jgi:hypothetical protein
MTPDLPTKGAKDASYAAPRGEGRAKPGPEDDRQASAVDDAAAAPSGFPTKPPVDTTSPNQKAQSSKGGDKPPPPPEQVRDPNRAEPGAEQYLRLTIRVDHGVFSIVDSHLVAGPLAQTTTLHAGHAYAVAVGGRVLHMGAIPDLGICRSFPHPEGTLEQRGHHSHPVASYEFDARVALADLRGVDPASIAVTLYRVKQPDAIGAPAVALDTRSFRLRREQHLREVGGVTGISPDAFPDGFTTGAPSEALRRPDIRKVRSADADDKAKE